MGRLLVGKPFWDLWGGRVFHTVIMAAVVAWSLQLFDHGMREFVDTTVQSTLLQRLAEPDYVPAPCASASTPDLANCISIVGIDDADFRGVFQQQSPLNPDELRKLFDSLRQHAPRVVAIDLDLSPASVEDWPARERLLASLQALSEVSRVVMVCPQGYSTPQPGPLDQEWVQRFGGKVRFASAELGADGLYFNKAKALPTLGVVSAEAAAESLHGGPVEAVETDWHQACLASTEVAHVTTEDQELIRPASVAASSYSQAKAQPELLAGRIVLVGGKWGINDQFKLRGQSDAFFGVNLHAWVAATELAPPLHPPEAASLTLEIVIGLVAGTAFAYIWKRIAACRERFGKRSFFYLLYFLLAFGLPLLWVVLAAHLAKLGLVLGAAGMVLSAAADSFLSAHETILEAEEKEDQGKHLQGGAARAALRARHQAPEPKPREFPGCLVALALAAIVFTVVWEHGHSVWVCLACGAVAGAVFGTWDFFHPPVHAGAAPQDSAMDLVARFIWTALKACALVWLFSKEHQETNLALVLGFLVCWALVYLGLRVVRKKRPDLSTAAVR